MFVIANFILFQITGMSLLGLFTLKNPDALFCCLVIVALVVVQFFIIFVVHGPDDKFILQVFKVLFSFGVYPFSVYALVVFLSDPETAHSIGVSPHFDVWFSVTFFLLFAYLYVNNFLYARSYLILLSKGGVSYRGQNREGIYHNSTHDFNLFMATFNRDNPVWVYRAWIDDLD